MSACKVARQRTPRSLPASPGSSGARSAARHPLQRPLRANRPPVPDWPMTCISQPLLRRPTRRTRAAARRLADAERRRRAAVGVRPAAAARVHLRHRVACAGHAVGLRGALRSGCVQVGRRYGGARPGGGFRAAPDLCSSRFAAAGARCGRKAETGRRRCRQERAPSPPDARRPGSGAGDAGRPDAPARRRPLRAEGGHRRRLPAGAGAAPRAALARGPSHDDRAARRPHRARGARPPRPEPAAARCAHRQPAGGRRPHAGYVSEGAGRPGARSHPDGAGCGDSRRYHSDTGASEESDTDLGALAEPAGSDGPNGCQDETGRRRHFDGEAVRFGPRDPGGGETAGLAAGRRPLQLRRSRDRTTL